MLEVKSHCRPERHVVLHDVARFPFLKHSRKLFSHRHPKLLRPSVSHLQCHMFTTLVVRFILGVQVTQTGEYETPSERVTALAESNELICPRWRVTIPSCNVSICFVLIFSFA